ncbi:hypothetical protein PybrP1_008314 [[Pythium] brassicae (nom. inval.)]|nr:hypothetical protein PybrP1_008314 [[Pythium] brassicae (nom. inval.)]
MQFGKKNYKADAGYPKLMREERDGLAELLAAFTTTDQPAFRAWKSMVQEIAPIPPLLLEYAAGSGLYGRPDEALPGRTGGSLDPGETWGPPPTATTLGGDQLRL